MKDYRNDFLRDMQTNLLNILSQEHLNVVTSVITDLLDKYELSERSTSIVPVQTANEQLLKTYFSNLLLDGKQKGTIYQYTRQLSRFCEYLGNKDLTAVTTFDIRRYLALLKTKGLSNTSIDTTRSVIMALYTWLTAEEFIQRNPCSAVNPIKCIKQKKRKFSTIDIDSLRISCETSRERAIIEFLLASGVRVNELVNLNVEDIDFNNRSVHVKHGKGNKERYTFFTELAKSHLVKYLTEEGITSGTLFLNNHGKRFTTSGIRFVINALAERANVDNVHPHRFRRTFASILRARGMEVVEIKELLGHEYINTTMTYIDMDDTATQTSYNKYVA